MTIHQAAAFVCPLGRHRHRPLACVALDDPTYLVAASEGRHDGECRPGTAFRLAVEVVVAQLRRNAEADVAAGRTFGPEDFAAASTWNADVLARATAAEARAARPRAGAGDRGREREREQPTLTGDETR